MVANPSRIGTCTGTTITREDPVTKEKRLLWQIHFFDTNQYQYFTENQLEVVTGVKEHPLDLIKKGKIGQSRDLRKLLTHVRLNGRLADLLYSMDVSNTDYYAYQFKPVIRMLNSVSNGLLIADEVGLGKTIEAGLIWTELKNRYELRRLFVLCPAFLREKWKRELKSRFNIDAVIVDAREAKTYLEHAKHNHLSSFAIIASMQGLRPTKGWDDESSNNKRPTTLLGKLLLDRQNEESLIDMLVIDEAHYLRLGDIKKTDKKTSKLGRLLRGVSDYIVLLSATPIHLRSDDLYQLLNIVDETTFNQPNVFDEILKANEPLIKAREAVLSSKMNRTEFNELITNALSNELLSDNQQLRNFLLKPPSENDLKSFEKRSEIASRLDQINLLSNVITRTRRRDVVELKVVRDPKLHLIDLNSLEKQFYDKVTEIVRDFCLNNYQYEGFILTTPQRQMSSSIPAALYEWKKKAVKLSEQLYEDYGFQGDAEKVGPIIRELISKIEELGDYDELYNNDSKYKCLIRVIKGILNDKKNEKLVLFSYFKGTLNYLKRRLETENIKAVLLTGDQKKDKEELLTDFRETENHNILLSSEIGSEGIDLQFCRILINYDLPWNPMKIEQRIGRIDRLGQQADKIDIVNLLYNGTIDARIYMKLHDRLKIFNRALGGLEPIIGEEIQKLTVELFTSKLTPQQEDERIEQTAQALENIRNDEERLEKEAAHLIAYGDYILNQVKAIKEMNRWITGKDIQIYVVDYLRKNFPGTELQQIQEDKLEYFIKLTNEAKNELDDFIKINRIALNTRLISNSQMPIKCRFENKLISESTDRAEVINQIHPIVRFVSKMIEKESFPFFPVMSIILKKDRANLEIKNGRYLFAIQKWSIKGLQDIEKLFYVAINIDDEKNLSDKDSEMLVTSAAVLGEDWLEASNIIDFDRIYDLANDRCLSIADTNYDDFVLSLELQNEDRANLQLKTLKLHLENQIETLQEIKQKHIAFDRKSLVKATEGKMQALESRFERKTLEIGNRKSITSEKEEIAIGLINLI
ncbi:MAG: DEAD/DEAH box helicase family protein [Ignavibacteria bacterium]|nr:DEAD/DEAH box helicase family protein [Ignavibacteria bacterium]